MTRIPLRLLVQDFLDAKGDWERARTSYLQARIIFEALNQLRKLEEDGPDAIQLGRERNYE